MHALKQDRFDVVYQPIYSPEARRTPVGYEALLRIDSVSPVVILGLARKLKLLPELERKVLQRILLESSKIPKERILFINASKDALLDPKWLDGLRGFKHGVVVEVQERGISDKASAALFRLKDCGIDVALDDLGQTLDDIEALEVIRPAYVKTDRSIVSSGDSSTLKRLKDISHGIGAKLVIEGIETEEQHWLGKENGDLLQGYYYARPYSIEHVI